MHEESIDGKLPIEHTAMTLSDWADGKTDLILYWALSKTVVFFCHRGLHRLEKYLNIQES